MKGGVRLSTCFGGQLAYQTIINHNTWKTHVVRAATVYVHFKSISHSTPGRRTFSKLVYVHYLSLSHARLLPILMETHAPQAAIHQSFIYIRRKPSHNPTYPAQPLTYISLLPSYNRSPSYSRSTSYQSRTGMRCRRSISH